MKLLLLCCLGLLPSSGDPVGNAPVARLGDAPVARVGETLLGRDDFGRWLVDRYGVTYVQEFVIEKLLLDLATERGMLPTQAEIDERFDAEAAHILKVAFADKPERWEADLASRGHSVEGWTARRKQEIRLELAQEKLVKADRQPDEELIAQRYRDLYGVDGERVSIEAIFFSAYREVESDAERPDFGALKQVARARAEAARKRWLAGATLAELRATADETGQAQIEDGVIAHYQRNLLGKEVELAIGSLDRPGDISPPVDVFDGTWILRLVERVSVSLEEARPALLEQLRMEPATSGEMSQLQLGLLHQPDVEILLH